MEIFNIVFFDVINKLNFDSEYGNCCPKITVKT